MSDGPIKDIAPQRGPVYPVLRSELIQFIEKFSSAQWTDYNTHDPGITLGEHLCFGITEDLHVAGLPIADLLTPAAGQPEMGSALFPAHEVLPCRPLTLADYRKRIIDQEGVRNAWIEETPYAGPRVYRDAVAKALTLTPGPDTVEIHPRGFLQVQVDFDGEPGPEERAHVLEGVRRLVERQRNLCEVFTQIEAVPIEEIGLCVELDATEDTDLVEVAARVFFELERFLSPTIPFYSLQERLAKGLSPEDIFDGPLLRHGFIDDDELERADRPDSVRTSDLVNILMDIPGLKAVRRLLMTSYRDGVPAVSGEAWLLPLDPTRAPRLSLARSRLLFYKRELPFLVESHEVEVRLNELRAAETGRQRAIVSAAGLPSPVGRRRTIDEFQTLLNLFPLNYGVGQAGLPKDSSDERLAQARQFKAFVVLCEQLLAGHRTQAARLPELLSLWRRPPVLLAAAPVNVREFDQIAGGDEQVFSDSAQRLAEPPAERLRRRSRIVDHFLARLAEPFQPYAVLSSGRARTLASDKLLADKLRLLGALPKLAHDRAAASDLLRDPADPRNISGLEQKLRTLLGAGRDLGSLGEVFSETTAAGDVVWRFRVKDALGQILLTSIEPAVTRDGARAELLMASRFGSQAERYVQGQVESGGFFYELLDDVGESIGRSQLDFATAAQCAAAIGAASGLIASQPLEYTFYVLEHVLLLPRPGSSELLPICDRDEEEECGACDDPYSFRITVVLPFWPPPLRNIYLREHLERLIREQTAAHLFVKICWVDETQMRLFGDAFLAWRRDLRADLEARLAADRAGAQVQEAQSRLRQARSDAERALATAALAAAQAELDNRAQNMTQTQTALALSQDALIRVWHNLRSIFPVATLHDCVDGNDENPVVLDKTLLGTFNEENTP
jgi:hypothetical protein